MSVASEHVLKRDARSLPSSARRFAARCMVALAVLGIAGVDHARAQTLTTLYAANVSSPDGGWTDASEAEGAPDATSNNLYAFSASGTTRLNATSFARFNGSDNLGAFNLPAGRKVTGVWVDVRARFNSGTTNNRLRVELNGSVGGADLLTTWSQSSGNENFGWRFADPNGAEITSRRASWSQSDVRNIDLAVRRDTGSTTLRVDSIRIIVRTEADTDGDGVLDTIDNCPSVANADQANCDAALGDTLGDVCDPDDDNDGTADANDCAPCDHLAWRNIAYADSDGDGIGAGSLVGVPCFGSVVPAGFSLVTGDNCPTVANADQANCDAALGDTLGNACDTDDDNDGTADANDCAPCDRLVWRNTAYADSDGDGIGAGALVSAPCHGVVPPVGFSFATGDNCPAVANPGQENWNADGLGDACQDSDGDGVLDAGDNCDGVANPNQANADGDDLGDVCDPCPAAGPNDDLDADCVANANDNCEFEPNPLQEDADSDGVGDACDPCPLLPSGWTIDNDGDGFGNECDNCPGVPNDQSDQDQEGLGDACDLCPLYPGGNPNGPFIDTDSDGVLDQCDACPLIASGSTPANCPPGVAGVLAYSSPAIEFTGNGSWQYSVDEFTASAPLDGVPLESPLPWTATASGGGQTGGGIICGSCPLGTELGFVSASVTWSIDRGVINTGWSSSASKIVASGTLSAEAATSSTMTFRLDAPVCYVATAPATGRIFTVEGVPPDQRRIGPGTYRITVSASEGFTAQQPFSDQSSGSWTMRLFFCSDPDTDADGYPDQFDNCSTTWNPDQADTTGCRAPDGVGDACQCAGDADRSGAVTFADVTAVLGAFGTSYCASPFQPACPPGTRCVGDANRDGVVSFLDVTAVLSAFGASCES